jgi:hypothetical protein
MVHLAGRLWHRHLLLWAAHRRHAGRPRRARPGPFVTTRLLCRGFTVLHALTHQDFLLGRKGAAAQTTFPAPALCSGCCSAAAASSSAKHQNAKGRQRGGRHRPGSRISTTRKRPEKKNYTKRASSQGLSRGSTWKTRLFDPRVLLCKNIRSYDPPPKTAKWPGGRGPKWSWDPKKCAACLWKRP